MVKTSESKNLLKINPTADIFLAVTVTSSEYSMISLFSFFIYINLFIFVSLFINKFHFVYFIIYLVLLYLFIQVFISVSMYYY